MRASCSVCPLSPCCANLLLFEQDEPRIYVESEDQPERMLLETKIVKDDGYQKQQGQTPDTRVISDNHLTSVCRHLNSMDGDKWHRHGIELPRSRWLRGHLVRTTTLSSLCVKSLIGSKRDFVSHVQQQLMALGPGESRSDIVVLEAQNG
jgi:hypothetical protein